MRIERVFRIIVLLIMASVTTARAQQINGTLVVQVRNNSRPVEQADVTIGDRMAVTNDRGEATFELPPGTIDVRIERYGFKSQTFSASISPGNVTRLPIELETEIVGKEEITVTATRSDTRIEDEPLRVEVLNREEVEEKALMTPGNIAMLLNETSGLRVQVTSPSLGAANVRVQGLRGRYTQLLSDGLPLYGGQSGSIGLLQIPPLDLGQVEVIKGTASALYGASALGGVINLVSRRTDKHEREMLLNATTQNGEDATFWLADRLKKDWDYTLLA
jgi:iron complex outermembrane receptor protein